MFSDCRGLIKIKTPYNINENVSLPAVTDVVWKDWEGKEYQYIPAGFTKSITLTRYSMGDDGDDAKKDDQEKEENTKKDNPAGEADTKRDNPADKNNSSDSVDGKKDDSSQNNIPPNSEEGQTTQNTGGDQVVTTKPDTGESSYKKPGKIAELKLLVKKSGKVRITWEKPAKGFKYQIQISEKSNFKKAKTYYTLVRKYTLKNLKKGKMYYVRIRACSNGKYGAWSKVKKVRIK